MDQLFMRGSLDPLEAYRMRGRLSILAVTVVVTVSALGRDVQRNRQSENRPNPQRGQRIAPTHPDEKYGEHEKQAFDLYLVDSEKPTPLFIWIHGGGFRGGDKRGVNAYMLKRFAEHGVSFASMNYRLSDVVGTTRRRMNRYRSTRPANNTSTTRSSALSSEQRQTNSAWKPF